MTDNGHMRKFLAIATLALTACGTAANSIPTTSTTIIAEDDIYGRWDCETMGNKVCGLPYTFRQSALYSQAYEMFASRDMTLPPIKVSFDSDACEDGYGSHSNDNGISHIKVCDESLGTLIHEMAHAWAAVNISDEQEQELLGRWNLAEWSSHNVPWSQRGTEVVAQSITFVFDRLDEDTDTSFGYAKQMTSAYADIMEVVGR